MKKIVTLIALAALTASANAQDAGSYYMSRTGEIVTDVCFATRMSPNGQFVAGSEGTGDEGVVFLWDVNTNNYVIESESGGDVWNVMDDGTILGSNNNVPAFVKDKQWTNVIGEDIYNDPDKFSMGYVRGANADRSKLVGAIVNPNYVPYPVLWTKDGDTYKMDTLDYIPSKKWESDSAYYAASEGAYALSISDDGNVIMGRLNDNSWNLVVWTYNETTKHYDLDNVFWHYFLDNPKSGNKYTLISPEDMSPNGEWITGSCQHDYIKSWDFDTYVFRYNVKNKKLEYIPFPKDVTAGEMSNRSASGFGIANDGSIVAFLSTGENTPPDRMPYIIPGGDTLQVKLSDYLAARNFTIPEDMSSEMGISICDNSKDNSRFTGFFINGAAIEGFVFDMNGTSTGITSNKTLADNGKFCSMSEGKLIVPNGCDRLTVYNMAGNEVYCSASKAELYDLSSLPNGIYIVKVERDGNKLTTRVLK
jgi:hypothetical protein